MQLPKKSPRTFSSPEDHASPTSGPGVFFDAATEPALRIYIDKVGVKMSGNEIDDNPFSPLRVPLGIDRVAITGQGGGRTVVPSGLLFLLFGYFMLPIFVVATKYASEVQDAATLMTVLALGLGGSLIPILIGWVLCVRTPTESGTRKYAVAVTVTLLLNLYLAAGRMWPEIVIVPGFLLTFRSLISLIVAGAILRYVQRTYAYLRPDETDRWMNLLNRLTM